MKNKKQIIIPLLAFVAGIALSYFYTRYQANKQIQAAGTIIQLTLTEEKYNVELLKLSDQTYALMADCLNKYSACNSQKTIDEVNVINSKRAAIMAQEEQNMAQLKRNDNIKW